MNISIHGLRRFAAAGALIVSALFPTGALAAHAMAHHAMPHHVMHHAMAHHTMAHHAMTHHAMAHHAMMHQSTLPFTGLDLRWIVGAGLLLLGLGFSILCVQMRSRDNGLPGV
jgi:pentapeptide MXKDX repeat protein